MLNLRFEFVDPPDMQGEELLKTLEVLTNTTVTFVIPDTHTQYGVLKSFAVVSIPAVNEYSTILAMVPNTEQPPDHISISLIGIELIMSKIIDTPDAVVYKCDIDKQVHDTLTEYGADVINVDSVETMSVN